MSDGVICCVAVARSSGLSTIKSQHLGHMALKLLMAYIGLTDLANLSRSLEHDLQHPERR
jgi:hypothetical protein